MGEFGSPSTNTHTHHPNNHRLHQFPFTVGSEIEVSIDEEGFKGALFKATILKLPTTFSPSKRKKALVEYKTLVTEDGSTPLKEHVDALSLRPLPPDTADKDFEECDIVDATDKDGWWTGVVCKVLEDGGYSVFFKNPMHVMDFQRNHLRLHQDWVDGKWIVPQKMEIEQQQASKNSYKRKRGRPRKLMLVPTTAEDSNQDGSVWKPEKATLKSSVTAKRTKRKKGFRKMPMCFVDFQDLNRRNGSEISAYKTNGSGTNSVDDDDRPLLMWLGGIQGSASNNAFKLGQASGSSAKRRTKGSEQVDALNEVRRVDGTLEHEVDKNHDWPFVKNSPVWSAIDSLEVFKHIPQKPHFQPLSTYKEECREGLAIGCMVTFASLVEKVTKLQFSYPRHIFESTLASLYELEQHGFNISMLCNRVNELLFIKDSEMRYGEETKVAENKIMEYIENKTKLAEESNAIEEKITELQKRQASIKQEMETTDNEIDALQSHVETIRECTMNTKLHFENQIALPLWPV